MSKFRIKHNLILCDDEGFAVRILHGRGGLLYTEGTRSVEVDSEFAGGAKTAILFTKSIKNWSSPLGTQSIQAKEARRIVENIVRAFQSYGYSTEVL